MTQEEMSRKAILEMKRKQEEVAKPAPKAKAKTNAKPAAKKAS